MLRHCSSVRSMRGWRPPPPMPALAKQPSTRPNAASVAVIAAFTEATSLTSQIRVSTLPGLAAIVAAARAFFSALRPQIETLHPAAASACAMPSPMPPLPPVTTATRLVRSKILIGVSWKFPWRFASAWRAAVRPVGRAGGRCQPWTSAVEKSNMASVPKSRPESQTTRATFMRKAMQFKHVTLDIDGSVAILTLDHQEVMNAISIDRLGGLADALDESERKKAEVR